MLHYGIRVSGLNTRLVWAKNQCKLGKFTVTDFSLCEFVGKQRKSERNQEQIQVIFVDTERGVNQYQVQFKNIFNLYLKHSIISNEK
jgi:hypothetical protein